jgi:DUF971 family protein
LTSPVSVDIERTEAVSVTWDDGRVDRFGLFDLRSACQCAECRGLRERGATVGSPDVTVVSAETVGAWGLSLLWSDGHATGIYPWDLLRSWGNPG